MPAKKPSRPTARPNRSSTRSRSMRVTSAPNVIDIRQYLIAKGEGGSARCQRLNVMTAAAKMFDLDLLRRDHDEIIRAFVDGTAAA